MIKAISSSKLKLKMSLAKSHYDDISDFFVVSMSMSLNILILEESFQDIGIKV